MAEKASETWISAPKKLSTAKQACLVHIYPTGPTMGCRYPLTDRPLVLGRAEDADIRLTDHSVSRRHAVIEPAGEGYCVSDQRSTNGTFVNDRVIEPSRLLRDGDYLRVGNCLYRYLAGGNIEAEYHEEIYRLTILDGLTQIHNKRYLDEFLEREVVRSQRHRRPLSVLAIDIDKFKTINDSMGHLCGDFLLRELAGVVRESVRQEDLFARAGGEEFVVVLVETTKDDALHVAERLREAVAAHEFRFESTPIKMTISIGLASTVGDEVTTPLHLRQEADQKLYEAKRTGRNRVCS
ncbi:GGDEF domain-containing protein [Gemmata sp. JC673]|uniref:diguanylate cyclase n=1 Tax=Gemmata algarum TaxID=2975278 RepID=A0ABU5FC19_9BACT|nr:GGDEF domain-containing protein [Gemmata algarum]MDY3563366.1 GGDEF domain-containing protein [Gemmata algarum]